MKKITGIILASAFVFVANTTVAPLAYAETATSTASTTPVVTAPSANMASLLATLKTLMAKVAELQAQLGLIKGQVHTALKDGLKEGMTDEDIRKIQELLASDREIYPAGKVTGFFGPMTTEALKRFQKKNGLEVTGQINAETKALLEEYRKEKMTNHPEGGFMKAPGIMMKMRQNMCSRMPVSANSKICTEHRAAAKGIINLVDNKSCFGKVVEVTWDPKNTPKDTMDILLTTPQTTLRLDTVPSATGMYKWAVNKKHKTTTGTPGDATIATGDLYKIRLQSAGQPVENGESDLFSIRDCR